MQFSAVLNIFIVKTQLNSTFTNDLKRKEIFSKNVHSYRVCSFKDAQCEYNITSQGSRSPDFGAEIRPHSQCQKVWFFPNSRQKIPNLTKIFYFFWFSIFIPLTIKTLASSSPFCHSTLR